MEEGKGGGEGGEEEGEGEGWWRWWWWEEGEGGKGGGWEGEEGERWWWGERGEEIAQASMGVGYVVYTTTLDAIEYTDANSYMSSVIQITCAYAADAILRAHSCIPAPAFLSEESAR